MQVLFDCKEYRSTNPECGFFFFLPPDQMNILINQPDFGMARSMDKGYYKTESKTMPVRWCSPEVLNYGKFSSQSDVWAFGVVMWEMFSYDFRLMMFCIQVPYAPMSNAEVIEKVLGGYRLPSPDNCPKEIYQCMIACWNEQVEQRPSLKQLYDEIERKWIEIRQSQPASVPSTPARRNIQQPVSNYAV